jgi:hypothetical protein
MLYLDITHSEFDPTRINTAELPLDVPRFKVLFYLKFSFNDPIHHIKQHILAQSHVSK